MKVIEQIEDMSAVSRKAAMRIGTWGGGGKSVILVPTMGALHEGHMALIEKACSLAPVERRLIVLSVFVNPTQFGPGEDLDNYPRTLSADKRLAEAAGVDIFFSPKAEDMYPEGFMTTVEVDDELSGRLCGADQGCSLSFHVFSFSVPSTPGHRDGHSGQDTSYLSFRSSPGASGNIHHARHGMHSPP